MVLLVSSEAHWSVVLSKLRLGLEPVCYKPQHLVGVNSGNACSAGIGSGRGGKEDRSPGALFLPPVPAAVVAYYHAYVGRVCVCVCIGNHVLV